MKIAEWSIPRANERLSRERRHRQEEDPLEYEERVDRFCQFLVKSMVAEVSQVPPGMWASRKIHEGLFSSLPRLAAQENTPDYQKVHFGLFMACCHEICLFFACKGLPRLRVIASSRTQRICMFMPIKHMHACTHARMHACIWWGEERLWEPMERFTFLVASGTHLPKNEAPSIRIACNLPLVSHRLVLVAGQEDLPGAAICPKTNMPFSATAFLKSA